MADADPFQPEPSPQAPAAPAGEERGSVRITDFAAAQLFAVRSPGSRSGARGWEPPSAAELQQRLPQYEVRALLGRGGMGAVYHGVQRSLERAVAIKILPPEMAVEDAQFPERFKLEGKAMAKLNHPAIVTVFDAGETADGLLYFVMEYVEGTDLQAVLVERGRLPAAEALPIVARVCAALEFAHSSGFIHRDIKPANIMVDARGEVKVADFGLARAITAGGAGLTGESLAIGTAEFAAPEAFLPGVNVDARADLYSVGVMLYQMLTGQIPRGRFAAPSKCVPGLDPRLDAIVDRAMQTDREKRYANAGELRADLERILTGSRAPRPVPSRRLLIGGVVAAGVILAAGVTFRPRPQPVAPTAQAGLATATREQPFVNSLGMRFVPVAIGGAPRVLFSVWETRVQDYESFVTETHREWPKPHFAQGPTHPAVNVSWDDAQAFCTWLTARERRTAQLAAEESYRLPTDHEWSCAVGIGDREDPGKPPGEKSRGVADVYPWGEVFLPPGVGNYSGEEVRNAETRKDQVVLKNYRDNFPATAPVASFPANRLGLFDLGGNAWEWCEDPIAPAQFFRVMRGASFDNGGRETLLSSARDSHPPGRRSENFGFRVVVAATARVARTSVWRPIPLKENPKLDGGFVHLVKFATWNAPGFRLANAAVRAQIGWQPVPPGHNDYVKVTARLQDTTHYYAYLTGPFVEVGLFQASKVIPLQRWPITPPPESNEVIPLQLACVGRHLAVWVRGRLVGTHEDATLTEAGNVAAQASDGHFQNLEYVDLDGLSEAAALTFLGLDVPAARR